MERRSTLLTVAALTAALGAGAFVSGTAWIAALAGLGAVTVASLSVRQPPRSPVLPSAAEASAPIEPVEPIEPVGAASVDGILDAATLSTMLRGRIAVARRALRPLSLVYLEVLDVGGAGGVPVPDEIVASMLEVTLRESDACGRRTDGVYAFILEETGEDGAVWTAERLRRKLTTVIGGRRFCAGIASYPNHGLDADALELKASAALELAREWRQDRIEVATGA